MELNKAANVAVIVAACVVIGLAVKNEISASAKRPASLAQQFVGKPLPLPDRSALGRIATAVLFVSKSCHFCADSMPFYQQLSAARSPHNFSVIAVVPEGLDTRDQGIAFFSDHGVTVDTVLPMRFKDVGVSGTPTLVLLDSGGRVKSVWIGALNGAKQSEVLSQIDTMITTRKVG
jgi:hypothetical protein